MKSQETTTKKASSWISSWWSGSSDNKSTGENEDPESMEVTEQQRQELYDAIDWSEEKATVAASVDMPKDVS